MSAHLFSPPAGVPAQGGCPTCLSQPSPSLRSVSEKPPGWRGVSPVLDLREARESRVANPAVSSPRERARSKKPKPGGRRGVSLPPSRRHPPRRCQRLPVARSGENAEQTGQFAGQASPPGQPTWVTRSQKARQRERDRSSAESVPMSTGTWTMSEMQARCPEASRPTASPMSSRSACPAVMR